MSQQRILLTGIHGQVGHELQKVLGNYGELFPFNSQQLDLASAEAILHTLNTVKPTLIVNPAAYTQVDKAEAEADLAFAINALAPKIIAQWAAEHHATFIHYSTDYVFDGTKTEAYIESDSVNPQSVYGTSKAVGEQHILNSGCNAIIVRTSWVYGLHGNNFIKTILRLAKERDTLSIVADQHGTPTSARQIAQATVELLKHIHAHSINRGVYHFTASGDTTWHDYAQYIVATVNMLGYPTKTDAAHISPIPTSGYPTPAKRPFNSRLNISKITSHLLAQPSSWQDEVRLTIENILNMEQQHDT